MSGLLEQLVGRIEQLERQAAELARPRPLWVTVADYAAARSISESTVRAAIAAGRLPAMTYGDTGRAIRVRADVEIGKPMRTRRAEAAGEDPAAFAQRAVRRVRR